MAAALLLRSPLPLAQLVRIKLPLAAPEPEAAEGGVEGEEPAAQQLRPPPLPAHFQRLQSTLERVAALASADLPFVAWVQDSSQLTVACAKVGGGRWRVMACPGSRCGGYKWRCTHNALEHDP